MSKKINIKSVNLFKGHTPPSLALLPPARSAFLLVEYLRKSCVAEGRTLNTFAHKQSTPCTI